MSNQEERVNRISQVKSAISQLASIPAESLTRRDELGPALSFDAALPDLNRIFAIMRDLNTRDLSSLSFNALTRVLSATNEATTLVNQIRQFTISQNNPVAARDSIVGNAYNTFESVYENTNGVLSYTSAGATGEQAREKRFAEVLSIMEAKLSSINDLVVQVEAAARSAKEGAASVQAQAAKAGVNQTAIHFKTEADEQLSAAGLWLKATIAIGAATGVAAIISLLVAFLYVPATVPETVQISVSKLIFFSVLSFALIWSARNYRAHRHNETLNRHRENALSTFQAFVAGTDDQHVKNAILLQASNAAFAQRPTGFDGSDGEAESAGAVVNLIERTLPTGNA